MNTHLSCRICNVFMGLWEGPAQLFPRGGLPDVVCSAHVSIEVKEDDAKEESQ